MTPSKGNVFTCIWKFGLHQEKHRTWTTSVSSLVLFDIKCCNRRRHGWCAGMPFNLKLKAWSQIGQLRAEFVVCPSLQRQVRTAMGGETPRYPIPGEPYGGFKPIPPPRWQSRLGYAFGVTMWLWVFYRAKNDLPHLLVSDIVICV